MRIATMAMMDRDRRMLDVNKESYRQIRDKWGEGYKLLGDELKRAIVAEHIIYVFRGLDEETVITAGKIEERHQSLLHFLGLDEE